MHLYPRRPVRFQRPIGWFVTERSIMRFRCPVAAQRTGIALWIDTPASCCTQ
jgi:hypothetical protein